MVATAADVLTGVPGRAPLPDDDVAGEDFLAWFRGRRASVSPCSSRVSVLHSPPYFLTPSRFPIEFLPFFELPPPRLVAVRTCMRPGEFGQGVSCQGNVTCGSREERLPGS